MKFSNTDKKTTIKCYLSPFKKKSTWRIFQEKVGLLILGGVAIAAFFAIMFSKNETSSTEPTNTQRQMVEVIDGDTIDVDGMRIRLHGIDAPERGQPCTKNGAQFNCGSAAKDHLTYLLIGERVNCTAASKDRWGRQVSICKIGKLDIGRQMVRQGWAIAYAEYSSDYVEDEQFARTNEFGMWSKDFAPPKDWRKQKGN